ncbi:MAG: NAD(+) diphosphatase [Desulfarculaceae bacterium]|nr:NAD(+) diphosphatase [Desulfarculaceae bacterium]MCF8072628.1 NAD(+) diphosphatase [Desulfarculaceae bacterium]MCF8103300.1 NAD(+) diphosphatase [Desulfarculaceae bacterium]MCF8117782.1 NAD(+) diphosphatase [Desulfarculaceae bacterium]
MPLDMVPSLSPPAPDGGPVYWLVFAGGKLLVRGDKPPRLAEQAAAAALGLAPDKALYVGLWQGRPCFTLEVDPNAPAPEGHDWHGLYGLAMGWSEETTFLAGRAKQLLAWERRNRYCGCCATPMEDNPGERARRCPSCGLVAYPRVSPAVIVAVAREGQVLLGRSPRFPAGRMSVLAGFVEPGETLEQTVAREVGEEVGVQVKDIRYFSSQPWPFPDSLMVGFTCAWAGGEIEIDGQEIVEAGWYGPDSLPAIPPRSTIARRLIDQVVGSGAKGPGGGWV